MKKLNVAVIGIGNMGKNHARNYFELEQCNLVAISDTNEALGSELAAKLGCKFYKDYKEMIQTEDIDCISIVVPTSIHKDVALFAMEHKKHILVEKPIAGEIEDAKKMILAAKKNKVKLMVGHIERFNPAVIMLKDLILQGKLGKITSIITRRVGVSPPQIKDANVIIDLAVHDIDIINYLINSKTKNMSVHSGKSLLKDREDHAEIFINYENGVNGYIQVNWITPIKIRNIAITGTKGYAELNYLTQELTLYESVYETTFDNYNDFIVKFSTPKTVPYLLEKKEPLKEELKSFLESVSKNKPVLVSGKDGLNALKIALKALEKAK